LPFFPSVFFSLVPSFAHTTTQHTCAQKNASIKVGRAAHVPPFPPSAPPPPPAPPQPPRLGLRPRSPRRFPLLRPARRPVPRPLLLPLLARPSPAAGKRAGGGGRSAGRGPTWRRGRGGERGGGPTCRGAGSGARGRRARLARARPAGSGGPRPGGRPGGGSPSVFPGAATSRSRKPQERAARANGAPIKAPVRAGFRIAIPPLSGPDLRPWAGRRARISPLSAFFSFFSSRAPARAPSLGPVLFSLGRRRRLTHAPFPPRTHPPEQPTCRSRKHRASSTPTIVKTAPNNTGERNRNGAGSRRTEKNTREKTPGPARRPTSC